MPFAASPSFHFASQASLLVYSATANASVVATLDSLQGVNQVAWSIYSTDDTTTEANYPITTSGPKGSICTIPAGIVGTGAILMCTVNNGVNPVTGNVDVTMSTTAKFYVPTALGLMIGCFDEEFQSGPQGWLGQHNMAIRAASGIGGTVAPTPGTVPMRDGTGQLFMIGLDAGGGLLANLGNLSFKSTAPGPTISQVVLAGTGATGGVTMTLQAQPGQQQTGTAANNAGGNLLLAGGAPGTGGSGAAGARGQVQLAGGSHTFTLNTTGAILDVQLDMGGAKIVNMADPTPGTQEGATAHYVDTMIVKAALTTADFVQPAPDSNVQISTTAGLNAGWVVGTVVAIATAGLYLVISIDSPTLTTIELKAQLPDGSFANPGDTVTAGKVVAPSGVPGNDGSNGSPGSNGINGDTPIFVSGSFVQPIVQVISYPLTSLVAVTVSVTSGNCNAFAAGQVVNHSNGGRYVVQQINNSTSLNLINLGYALNITVGGTVSSGTVVAAGFDGATGATGSTGATGAAGNSLVGRTSLGTDLTLATNINFATMDTSMVVNVSSGFAGGVVQFMAVVTLTSTVAATVSLRFLIDNVSGAQQSDNTLAAGESRTIMLLLPGHTFTAGAHTVEVQWKTTASSAECRPTSAPGENASLSLVLVG